jgi:hypothetical protein
MAVIWFLQDAWIYLLAPAIAALVASEWYERRKKIPAPAPLFWIPVALIGIGPGLTLLSLYLVPIDGELREVRPSGRNPAIVVAAHGSAQPVRTDAAGDCKVGERVTKPGRSFDLRCADRSLDPNVTTRALLAAGAPLLAFVIAWPRIKKRR